MRGKKIGMAVLAGILLVTAVTGCQKKETAAIKEVIQIPVMFLVNPDTGDNENEKLVNAFNKKYEGTYEVQVEWITDTAEGYRSRIKTLNAVDKLPAVITDAGFDADFYQLLVKNHRLVNLEPYFQKDEAWENALGQREIDNMREKDGRVYLSSSGNSTMSYAGFYYNKQIFADAGITQFPKDWDAFFSCLDQLKEQGITPLAIHGGGGYWTPLLMSTGYVAGTKEGMEFLEQQYPESYQNESAAKLFSFLKRLYSYADADALTIERTESAERFMQGKAAITANGGWLIDNMSKEEKDQFGFAAFPGDVMMEDMKMSAWAVTTGSPTEVTRGALEFLRFRALWEQKQETTYLSVPAESEVEKEYRRAIEEVQTVYPNYQLKWETAIQEKILVDMIPAYVTDEIDEESFLKSMTEEVQAINKEK